MHSCAWMNGQPQQVGQSSQAATQLTYDAMRNQQAGTANKYCQYMKVNSEVRLPQSAHLNFWDGGNRQMSNCQTSTAPHQEVSFQQPAGGKDNNYYLKALMQNTSTNTKTGKLVTNGFQGPTQHNFNHNSAPNSSSQSPPSKMMANTTYPQQDMPPYWNQPVHRNQSIRAQDGDIVSDLQHYGVQKTLHQNLNGELMKPISAYTTTATSLLCEKDTSTLMSAIAHNRQPVHIQIHRQNATQHGLPHSSPPCYSTAVLQSLGNNSYTAKSLSSGQILCASSMSHKTQQYAPQLNTTPNVGQEATSVVDLNSYNSRHKINTFLSKRNAIPFNPTAGAQQKMLTVARIADSLQKSDTAGLDGHRLSYTSSSYREKQVVGEVRMTEFNQTLQPMTSTVAQTYNSNITQVSPLCSGQYLSKTAQNVMSRTQHLANVPPQQNSAADSFYVTAAGDGSGKINQADSALSKRSLVESSRDVSQLMQMLENISPQKDKIQPSAAKTNEMLERLSPVKQSDSSIHSSPGRNGTRAVAVVQPLSQESYQVASKHTSFIGINQSGECSTTDESLCNPDKLCISPVEKNQKAAHLREGFNVCTGNANQKRLSEFAMKLLATPNDDTVVPSSSSAWPQDLSQKQLGADETGSEPAINMQADQWIETAAQQSVTSEVTGSQKSNVDKREMPTELSSLPTTPWTRVMLTNLVKDEEEAQKELEDFTEHDTASKILTMFWNGKCKMLADKLKTGWYKDLIINVREFCAKRVTADPVLLLQVKHGFGKLLKSYHVLQDNEVYSEPTYKSSWLNVNEQVDDIDKEFGFSWSLKHHLIMLESDSEPDQDRKASSIPAQIESEVPNKVLSQTELEPVDSGEEKQALTGESTLTQASSPCKTDCADLSDSFYAFEIQVLPPEQAKMIFEQVQSKMAQSTDMDNQSEEVANSPTEGEPHEVKDVTLKESKREDESVSTIEQVCCISRWLEIIVGSNMPSLSKCQCKEEQSHEDCADKTLDKEQTAAEKSSMRSDLKFHSAAKDENQGSNCDHQANGREKIMTFICPEFSNKLSQNIDFNEDNNKPHIFFDKDPKKMSHISINESQSNIILVSKNEAEDNSGSENEFPKQLPEFGIMMKDPEEECDEDQLKSAGSRSSNDSENGKKEIRKVFSSEVANQISDPEEHCAQARWTSTEVTASSPESREEKCEGVERKRKTLSSKDGILPFVKKLKKCNSAVDLDSQPVFKGVKCKKNFVDAPETKPLATNGRTVELVLFGSASQDTCAITGSRKRQISSSKAAQMPPEVLTMNLSPLSRIAHVPTGAHSAKQRIYEKWRSLPPTQIRHRSKLKAQKCTFASLPGWSLKKIQTAASTNTMKPSVSSEMRMWNKNSKHSLSLNRRRSLSNGVKIREEKTKNDVVTLKQTVDQVRSESDNGSHAFMPLKENNVLRFSVLPNTFNFKYGSSERKEITDPVSDIPDCAEDKDKCPNKTIMRERGTIWYPNPEKKYCPLPSPPVPKIPGLFQEFQKKYMQKTQLSTDK